MADEPLLSAGEVAQLLGVSKRWVYRAAQRGDLLYVRVGRLIRFRHGEIDAYLDRQSASLSTISSQVSAPPIPCPEGGSPHGGQEELGA